MKKLNVINQIKELGSDRGIIFTELLDDGRKNERTIQGSKENLVKILEDNFDEDLHGHFGDEVWTTIKAMGYYIITTTEV
jgi:hypothetical protein